MIWPLFWIALVLGLIWVAVILLARSNEAAAERDYPPEGEILTVDGTRVHAVVMGDGPDLVLIHGASGNTRDMSFSLAPKLAERYRVIVLDRPGLGYTDWNGVTSLRAQAELLQQAAAQLGATAPLVMGQSYGGAVALAWAVHRPETLSGLIPLAAVSHPWDTPLDPLYRLTSSRFGQWVVVPILTALVGSGRVEQAVQSIFDPQPVPEGYVTHVGAGLTLRRDSLRANALQRAELLDHITAMAPKYSAISVPVEILHGTADTTVGLAIHSIPLSRAINGSVLTRLPDIGHMPQHWAEGEVIDAIDRVAARAGLR